MQCLRHAYKSFSHITTAIISFKEKTGDLEVHVTIANNGTSVHVNISGTGKNPSL